MVTRTEVEQLDKYFNLVNYMSVGQLYLLDNPLLKRKLELKDVKPRLVGHWGTVPGQNFILMHCNRVITKYDLDMMYIIGPGHGGEAEVTNAYLDGTYQEVYEKFNNKVDLIVQNDTKCSGVASKIYRLDGEKIINIR